MVVVSIKYDSCTVVSEAPDLDLTSVSGCLVLFTISRSPNWS